MNECSWGTFVRRLSIGIHSSRSHIGNLPWKEIIRHTPTLVESSRKLYESLRKPRDQAETSVDELRSTLRELESRIAEQSRLGTEVAHK